MTKNHGAHQNSSHNAIQTIMAKTKIDLNLIFMALISMICYTEKWNGIYGMSG